MHKFSALMLAATANLFVGAVQAHDLQGLLDTSGKTVIPIKYQKIQYLDKGIYRCFSTFHQREWRPRGSLSYQPAKDVRGYHNSYFQAAKLLDKNGETIDISPPVGCVITAVHVPRELLNPLRGKKVKPNVFFTIHGDEGNGLIDWRGKVVVPPEYDSIDLRTVIYCKSWRSAIVWRKPNLTREIPLETAIDENTGVDTQSKYNNPKAGYSLVKNLEQTFVCFKGKQLFALPTGYTNFELINDSRILATDILSNGAPQMPSIVMDKKGNCLNKLPERSRIVKISESGLIVDQRSEKTAPAPYDRKLYFIDCDGNVRKEVSISDLVVPGFKLGLAVLPTWTSDRHCNHAVVREDGVELLPPQMCDFEIAEKDRIIKTEFQSKFDSEECRADRYSLAEQFSLLRKDYDLIGMPRKKLECLVGKPDRVQSSETGANLQNVIETTWYQLTGFESFCGNASSSVEFRFKNGVVTGWRLGNGGDTVQRPWVEENEVHK
ncbi:MAG: WG repeat-containing protein [Candidatus Obscuribacterales bacterium]|nr:WG repeat-containing protein [Candidatus Obscuribacterales bacterium]